MSKTARRALVVYAFAVALVFTAQALWPEAAIFKGPAAEAWLLRLGAFTKLPFLGLAWYHARAATRALEDGNPALTPWRLMTLGFLGFALGQSMLVFYQLVLGQSPYPSLADIFFICAYPLLIAAFFGFISAYRESGYPVGTPREHATIGLILAAVFVVISFVLLRPVLAQPGPLLERVITAAYPFFDFVLLVPVLILLRITAPFRGGAVFHAWALVLFGVVALCAGDILYAYFQVLGRESLGPLVDATYVLAYLGLALGALEQRTLLEG